MKRRGFLQGLSALLAMVFGSARPVRPVPSGPVPSGGPTPSAWPWATRARDHECQRGCEIQAENLARASIRCSGAWKIAIQRYGPMLYTVCGETGCEVWLSHPPPHPDWEYQVRSLTVAERASFRREYGRSHWAILGVQADFKPKIRGFVLNGREPGWKFSTPY